MSKKEEAVKRHDKGYNCAQAVACSFAEELGIDEQELFRSMEAFGFGMGCMGTCGAVSAMAAVAGLKESDGNMDAPGSKRNSYKLSKAMIREFEEKVGSTICAEIKGVETGKVLRSCEGCIEDAAEIVDKHLSL